MNSGIKNTAQKLQERVTRVREYVNDINDIKAFITNRVDEIKLNKRQEASLARYQFIYGLMAKAEYIDSEIVAMVTHHFKVSASQAQKDLYITNDIYNTVLSVPKRLKVKLMMDILEQEMTKARDNHDGATLAKLSKEYRGYLDMVEDDHGDMKDLLTPHQNVIQFDPSLIGVKVSDEKDILDLFKRLESTHGFKVDDFIEEAIVIESDEE
jgi:hypothetical protein